MTSAQRLAARLAAAQVAWDAARTERALRGLARRRARRLAARVALTATAMVAVIALARHDRADAPAATEEARAATAAGTASPTEAAAEAGTETAAGTGTAAEAGTGTGALAETGAVAGAETGTIEMAAIDVPRARRAAATELPALALQVAFAHSAAPAAASITWRAELLVAPAPVTSSKPSPPRRARDAVGALLREADALRRRGEPVGAIPLLRAIVDGHPGDPRAPAAAFTLGRVQLAAGDPGGAARAFDRARALAPDGPLAEDALAREVEAWARAGDRRRARDRAREYLATYPDGARAAAVRRHADR